MPNPSMTPETKVEQRKQFELTRDMLAKDIEREGEMASWMIRSGLLRDILDVALARFESTLRAPADVRDELRHALANAFAEGCRAVHENYQEDRDPDFTEAANEYADSALTWRAILSLLRQPEQGREGWLPIESAPKDGAILGYMPNRVEQGRPYMAVIFWDDEFNAEDFDEETGDVIYRSAWCAGRVGSFAYEQYAEEHPTHWMPLPSAPVDGDRA